MALTVKARFGHDLRDLAADLDSVGLGLHKLIGEVGKRKLAPLVAEVRGLLPFDPEHRGWRGAGGKRNDPGHIRDSVTGGLRSDRFSVFTSHPGGPVHWWGGTIRPKGAAITIRPEAGAGEDFISKTEHDVVAAIDTELDQLLRRHGL